MSQLQEAAPLIGAAATVLAVLAALFRDEIRSIWKRPKLVVSIKLGAPDCHKTFIQYTNMSTGAVTASGDCYYFRLWIRNDGRMRAEKVQVFIARILKKHADGDFKEDKSFLPMNLKWAHSQTQGGLPEVFADGISPKMGKHCDLGHILHPLLRAQTNDTLPGFVRDQTLMSLDLEVQPNTRTHLVPPGVYRLELKIGAANAKPINRTFEMNLTGLWSDDETKMFADGIGIK